MKIAIVDERMPNEAKRKLSLEGFYIIEASASKKLPQSLASHPDMLLFHDRGVIISSAEYCEEAPMLFEDISRLIPGLKITFTADSFSKEYPHDAIFNALVIGGKIFLKEDSVSRAVLDYATARGLEISKTKQGYPACTCLALSENAAITADKGMADVLSAHGIRVTLIENGDISLPPYEYGFIGGASGVFQDKVYFIGDYTRHRCAAAIEAAVRAEGLTPISLGSFPLCDLGRIIFINSDI